VRWRSMCRHGSVGVLGGTGSGPGAGGVETGDGRREYWHEDVLGGV
jgi:hypothetical protein